MARLELQRPRRPVPGSATGQAWEASFLETTSAVALRDVWDCEKTSRRDGSSPIGVQHHPPLVSLSMEHHYSSFVSHLSSRMAIICLITVWCAYSLPPSMATWWRVAGLPQTAGSEPGDPYTADPHPRASPPSSPLAMCAGSAERHLAKHFKTRDPDLIIKSLPHHTFCETWALAIQHHLSSYAISLTAPQPKYHIELFHSFFHRVSCRRHPSTWATRPATRPAFAAAFATALEGSSPATPPARSHRQRLPNPMMGTPPSRKAAVSTRPLGMQSRPLRRHLRG